MIESSALDCYIEDQGPRAITHRYMLAKSRAMAPKKVATGKPAANVVPMKRVPSKQAQDDEAKRRKLSQEADKRAQAEEAKQVAKMTAKEKKLNAEVNKKAKAALALVPVAVQTSTVVAKAGEPCKKVKAELTEDDEENMRQKK